MAPDTDDTRVGSSYDDFSWTSFYSEFANRLLTYRHDRPALLAAIDQLPAERVSYLTDRFADGSSGRMRDICPFTTMGAFNRRLTDANRRTTALKLAEFLGMEREPLRSFAGIPILDNRASWFFPYEGLRDDDHIDALWQVFADAIAYADGPDKPNRASLIDSFNDAVGRKHVRRKLTMGLYWIRPWTFVPLDWYSREFIGEWLDVDVSRVPAGETYLDLCDELLEMFNDESMPVHSFPELSLGAWEEDESEEESDDEPEDETEDEPDATADNTDESPPSEEPVRPYSVDDVIAEGCFLDRSRLEAILDRWRVKKNLILQGPPGTGKTWLAKRLAFALIGYRSLQRVRPVQFHPNLSYEDFVRGWRPSGDSEGRLKLLDGPFLRAVEDAANDPARDHVVVIEEINRGNPAQIFGEMLTLLEADKRNADEALELSYPRRSGERVHIPGNLFVVGTMNIADRSLALVDLALRRRFAFVDLAPTFGDAWHRWVTEQNGLDAEFLDDVGQRLTALNQNIAGEPLLGPQFRIGHSVVTPSADTAITDPVGWFTQVVETEIGPLLEEYWFDAADRARSAKEDLLKGLDR